MWDRAARMEAFGIKETEITVSLPLHLLECKQVAPGVFEFTTTDDVCEQYGLSHRATFTIPLTAEEVARLDFERSASKQEPRALGKVAVDEKNKCSTFEKHDDWSKDKKVLMPEKAMPMAMPHVSRKVAVDKRSVLSEMADASSIVFQRKTRKVGTKSKHQKKHGNRFMIDHELILQQFRDISLEQFEFSSNSGNAPPTTNDNKELLHKLPRWNRARAARERMRLFN
ncbi:UBX domain-containing protein [Caenorhabditis elegans]|uniref:UBX domain-containing protein n=1 Tax=Caenorhabditis elegans TaxID=6239 RepID=Q21711_CAEEL|nr:UBX domain-containing protein [Caenorhabditis elegans]CAA94161.1 UBX domain-containing protein [Caenorhabditis elegans]|eukprot:NP_510209.1 Uncharacterized protein CELE_R04D3.4 [Caenorhabditis elegans]